MRLRWGVIVGMVGCFYLVLAVLFAAYWAIGIHMTRADYKPTHTYNYKPCEGELSTWEGEEIKSNGFTVEIWLHGRLDTILPVGCGITEAPEPVAPAPAPDPVPRVYERPNSLRAGS